MVGDQQENNVIDFFTKKPYVPPIEYAKRNNNCLNVYKTTGKLCTCEICKAKKDIIERLVVISNYLCLDYIQKTGNDLYFGDWYQIVLAASIQVGEIVYPKM